MKSEIIKLDGKELKIVTKIDNDLKEEALKIEDTLDLTNMLENTMDLTSEILNTNGENNNE